MHWLRIYACTLLPHPQFVFPEMMFLEDLVAKEKEIAIAQAEGKPPQAIEKIVAW